MAQSGFTPISLYYSATGAAVPTAGNLVAGELALNTNDGKLYFKNSAGVVTLLAGSTSGPAGGSNTQVQYNNSGVLAGITGATSNGTALTLVAPNLGSPSSVGTMPAFTLGGTVSGGGNQINNVVIGTTTPLAGAFTTGAFSDTVTSTKTNGYNWSNISATTGLNIARFTGSNSDLFWGTENSAGNGIIGTGGTAYAAFFGTNNFNTPVQIMTGSVVRGTFSSTGLAVTGTLSAASSAVVTNNITGSFTSGGASANNYGVYIDSSGATNNNYAIFVAAGTSKLLDTTVTGALSATGTLSGGTSGTGYSFSGSAPATSLTLDASGNLGIGETASLKRLTVKGSTTDRTVEVIDNGANDAAIMLQLTGVQEFTIGVDRTDSSFKIADGGSLGTNDRLVIDTSGNLGLGVTPSAWGSSWAAFQLGNRSLARSNAGAGDLTMVFNGYFDSTDSRWEFQNSGDYAARYSITGAGIHSWHTSTAAGGAADAPITFTQAMTLTAAGQLLIGTTTSISGSNLTIGDGSGATGAVQYLNAGTNGAALLGRISGSSTWLIGDTITAVGTGTGLINYVYGANPWIVYTNNVERARIDSSGNLLVGATSGSVNTFLKDNANDIVLDVANSSSSNCYGLRVRYSAVTPNTVGYYFYRGQDSSATRFEVYSNGGIANYSANNSNLSDRREKTNFAPAKSYLDVICAIPVQTFNYIDQNMEDDAGLTLGVVAQDVQAVAPELVMESNWASKDEEPKMRLSIYQTDLQYALMKCIQEQQALITQLTARITALETA